jgi:hypothetical protein
MLRRIAITVAAVSAAGFLSAVPAVAYDGGYSGTGGYHNAGGHAGFEHVNLGGPYGITATSGSISGYEHDGGYSYEGHHHFH